MVNEMNVAASLVTMRPKWSWRRKSVVLSGWWQQVYVRNLLDSRQAIKFDQRPLGAGA